MNKIIPILLLMLVPLISDAKSFTTKYKGSRLLFQTIKDTEGQVVCKPCPIVKVDTLFIPGCVEHNGVTYQVKETRVNRSMDDYYGTVTKRIKVLVIEEGVEVIGEESFSGYSDLLNVSLPTTLKRIEELAFALTGLCDIIIPESVEYIGMGAFMANQYRVPKIDGMYYRGTITLPRHGLTIERNAFATVSPTTNRTAVSYFKILQLPENTTKGQIAEWSIGKADESMIVAAQVLEGIGESNGRRDSSEMNELVEY